MIAQSGSMYTMSGPAKREYNPLHAPFERLAFDETR